jgi:soluble lytic murein transglycosylase-like protein
MIFKTLLTMLNRSTASFVLALALAGLGATHEARAGAQAEEALSSSVQASLQAAISDRAAPKSVFLASIDEQTWVLEMSGRLAKKIPDTVTRTEFLRTVHYEASRAGLDPQMVMGLIQVESNFRKYAVSSAGARGYMQVMPFWQKLIGTSDQNLFHLRTNLRYGCTILRHYLDIERGDYFRALGRYNGSLGKPEYPNLVLTSWHGSWKYDRPKYAAIEGNAHK